LIWIDGAHGYPVVPMDIINSYRLCSKGGFVLVDDIFVTVNTSDSYYKSVGGFKTLTALKVSKLITDFTLFNKRLGGHHNLKSEKKYVGLFQKK
jgi:hypothetical protein